MLCASAQTTTRLYFRGPTGDSLEADSVTSKGGLAARTRKSGETRQRIDDGLILAYMLACFLGT